MSQGSPAVGAEEAPFAAIACTSDQHHLGEGARWDGRRGELLRVDIMAGHVYRDRVDDDGGLVSVRAYQVPGTVGAVAPVEGDEGWLLAAGRGFVYLSPDRSLRPLVEVAPPGSRMNDAVCDPQGRFWAGALADDHRPGGGSYFCFERNGSVRHVLGDLTIPNGLGWSPDGATAYFTDSGPGVIQAFDFDGEHGSISGGRPIVKVPEEVGVPDGMTVDAEGDLWVAIYGGGRIHRYSPEGVLRQVLHVPAAETTSCAFAGTAMNLLYVTTATENWSDEQRRAQPSAGLTYRFQTTARGLPAAPFRPQPTWWSTAFT